MNDLDKAKKLVFDKNVSLSDLSSITKIPLETLKNMRYKRSKIENASWSRVHLLAEYYDCFIKPNAFFREVISLVPRREIKKLRLLNYDYDYFKPVFKRRWRNLDTNEIISDVTYKKMTVKKAMQDYYSYQEMTLDQTITSFFNNEDTYKMIHRGVSDD